MPKRNLVIIVLIALPFFSKSQENSPYSRYGIGNLTPSGNIFNRGMGGISAGMADPTSINFLNPASYSNLIYTTFDVGADFASRTIRSTNPQASFTSKNAIISYLQFGFPLLNGNKKAIKKNMSWGLNFGLRPISKINYKIENNRRIPNIDSLQTTYEGSGGVNEAFIGTGIRFKNFSIGLNAGYAFGNKDYGTRLIFINDTVPYLKSNSATTTHFGGGFLEAGIQYNIELKKNQNLNLGAFGKLKQTYTGTQDILRESFSYNSNTGNPDKLDSIYQSSGIAGKVVLPSSFGVGFSVTKFTENHIDKLVYGADFEMTNWNNYSFYGQKDAVKNNWMTKAGIQYYPANSGSRKYWNFVKYRAGIYFGTDYIAANRNLPLYGITLGGGFPLKIKRSFYETQYSLMNVALDYGNRGNNNNLIRENIFHISIGFSLSDVWFNRSKYQ